MVVMANPEAVGGMFQQLPRWLGLPDCENDNRDPREDLGKLGHRVFQPRVSGETLARRWASAVCKAKALV